MSKRRRRRPAVHFVVPARFDAASLLPPELARHADCANYFVHLVTTREMLRRMESRGDGPRPFVPLKVEYLRNVAGRNHERPVREAVVDGGVVETDGQYIVGEKAMGYRVAESYVGPTRMVPCGSDRVAAKVLAARSASFTGPRSAVHRYLDNWAKRMRVNIAAARRTILDTPRLAEYADVYLTATELIAAGQTQFTVCDQGRVHTVLTRLPKRLRKHLRVDGRKLVGIDVRNSQPLILSLLFPPPAQRTPDQAWYTKLCEDGMIYEHLHQRGIEAGELPEDMPRGELKAALFRDVFYGAHESPMLAIMEHDFPTVGAMIRAAKVGDHGRLARLMQTRESDIIIGKVCGRLMRQHPDVPVLTVHDMVMTTPEHAGTIMQVMRETLTAAGVQPHLTVDG